MADHIPASGAARRPLPTPQAAPAAPQNLAIFLDLDGNILYLNAAVFGLRPEEVVGTPIFDYVPEGGQEPLRRAMEKTRLGGGTAALHLAVGPPTGDPTWWAGRISPVKRSGELEEFLLIGSRSQPGPEERSKELEERQTLMTTLSSVFIDMPRALFGEGVRALLASLGTALRADRTYWLRLGDDAGTFHMAAEWCAAKVAARPAPLKGVPIQSLGGLAALVENPALLRVAQPVDRSAAEGEKPRQSSAVHSRILAPVRQRERLTGCLVLDFPERKEPLSDDGCSLALLAADSLGRALGRRDHERAQEREREALYRLTETLPVAVALIRRDGLYLYVNPGFTALFGYTRQDVPTGNEWFAKAFPEAEERRRAVESWLHDTGSEESGLAEPRTFFVTCKEGERKEIRFRTARTRSDDTVVTAEDLGAARRRSSRRRADDQLEGAGRLAGRLVHELNNLLMVIHGRSSIMMTDLDASHPHYASLVEIEEAVRRCTELTTRLRLLSGGARLEACPVDFKRLVARTVRVFARRKKDLRVRLDLPEEALSVQADPVRVEQALFHLYDYAAQRTPSGGNLSLTMREKDFKPPEADRSGVPAGRYGMLTIRDTGEKLVEDARAQLFVKSLGPGNGAIGDWGLPAALRVLRQLGGTIEVDSEGDSGMAFTLILPVSTAPPAQPAVDAARQVLLIDDDREAVQTARTILEAEGFQVLSASAGATALETLVEHGREIGLVLLSLHLPDMAPEQLLVRLKAVRPEARFLLCSERGIDRRAVELLRQGCHGFVSKPYRAEELTERVREALGSE